MTSNMKLKYLSLIVNILFICDFVLIIECNSEFNKENDWHKNWHFVHHFQQILNNSELNDINKYTRRTLRPTPTPGSMADILMVDPNDPSQQPQPPLIFTSGNNPPEPVFGHIDHNGDQTLIRWTDNRLKLDRESETGAPQSSKEPPFFAMVERTLSPFISIVISNISVNKLTKTPNSPKNIPEHIVKEPESLTKVTENPKAPVNVSEYSEIVPDAPTKILEAVNPTEDLTKESKYAIKEVNKEVQSNSETETIIKEMEKPTKADIPKPGSLMHIRVPLIDVKCPIIPSKAPVKPIKIVYNPVKETDKPIKEPDSMPVLEPQPLPPSTKPLEERKDCVVKGKAGSCFPFFPFHNVFDCFKSGGIVAMDIVRCSWVRACCVPNFFR